MEVKGYRLNIKAVKRAGLSATKVDVETSRKEGRGKQRTELRRFKDVRRIIKDSSLSKDIKQKGLSVFKRLFEAEAKVHGEKYDRIHLHELGAIDCIVDIFGTLIGFDILGIKRFYSSPVNLGSGMIGMTVASGDPPGREHGILPVPAPATAELLKNARVYSSGTCFELTTPTGAAIVSTLAGGFGPMPCMDVLNVGVGAGNKDLKDRPNVLRLFIGQYPVPCGTGQGTEDKVIVIETNIDDMNPQIYEYVIEKLFKAGALDVFLTQVIMKKGRPGIKLTALCIDDKKEDIMKIILRETTSIGLRFYEAQRKTLHREIKSVHSKFGKINVKISRLGKDILNTAPEYRDCRKIAKKFNIPLLEVMKLYTAS
ncbi:MAG: nickel pincer cofactor biosynthesis protein LarC [Candidatus Mariimomonas ferrooxydans]